MSSLPYLLFSRIYHLESIHLFSILILFWETRGDGCFIGLHLCIFWDIDFDVECSFELLEFFIASLHLEFEGFDFIDTEEIDIEIEGLEFTKENIE